MASFLEQINKGHPEPASINGLPNGQYPADALVPIKSGKGTVIGSLCAEAARAWSAMAAAAIGDGVNLSVTTPTNTYRPLQDQQRIFDDRYRTTDQGNGSRKCGSTTFFRRKGVHTAACPGTSNHGRGLAVDVKDAGDPGPVLTWLEGHAAAFGFEWELAEESWHIHYTAADHPPAAVLNHQSEEDDVTDKDKQDIIDAVNEHVDARVNKAVDDLLANVAGRLDKIDAALKAAKPG